MMESDSSEGGSAWSRICNHISSACGSLLRKAIQTAPELPQWADGWQGEWVPGAIIPLDDPTDYTITWTSDDTSTPMSGFYTNPPSFSMPLSAWSGLNGPPQPVSKKCNYCGQETPDFRELRIGRLTTVVVCDMCMLKALSKTLEVPDDGGDEGSRGSPGDDEHKPGAEGP